MLSSDPSTSALATPYAEGWAWLDAGEGRRYCGSGPFSGSAAPSEDGVSFYVNDFALSEKQPWRVAARNSADSPVFSENPPGIEWAEPGRDAFAQVFDELMSAVRSREILKAVPAVCASGVVQSGSVERWMRTLLTGPRDAAVQGIPFGWSDGSAGFGGYTPEILFALDGCRLTTMALAGTTDAEHAAELTERPKLAREHTVVVDELQRRLAALGKVKTGERKVVHQGNIRHLRTELEVTVSVEPRGEALNEIVRLMHPTPALGISPRSPENMARLTRCRAATGTPDYFGAPFGVAWAGGALFVVAIRGIFWELNRVHLPTGCGLVAGSELDAEWAELELKRAWVQRVLGL